MRAQLLPGLRPFASTGDGRIFQDWKKLNEHMFKNRLFSEFGEKSLNFFTEIRFKGLIFFCGEVILHIGGAKGSNCGAKWRKVTGVIGKSLAKVDEKGRLIVPAKLRGELGELFYVTIGINDGYRCLTAYTKQSWEDLCRRYDALPLAQKSGTTSFLFSYAVECVPDKQFRFLLSGNLFEYAGITKEVAIVGRAGQAEIWDAATYADFERTKLTPENLFSSLEAIGL